MKVIIALLVVLNLNIYCQQEEMQNKTNGNKKIEKLNTSQAATGEIKFKNETGNAIITLTDEGNNAGSILFPSVGSLLSGAKLYSNGANLFWGNSQLNKILSLNDLSDAKSDGENLFLGNLAGFNNEGLSNTAIGYFVLASNTTGSENTSSGFLTLRSNTTGSENTATGCAALRKNITGIRNTANGRSALYSNTDGNYNTATGYKALYNNTSGDWNTAIGRQALYNTTTGNNNIGIGYDAQVPNPVSSNQIRIGNASIIYAGIQVGWSVTSDRVWKEQIRTLPYGLDIVMQLKPVDYIRKNSERKTREIGFIAQDVEKLLTEIDYKDQGFLTKDNNGRLNLRYNDFIALNTKALQEQQEIIKKQGKLIAELEERIKNLEKN
ncbi:MAG: tail fiber domain-containing protein [Melioribacteraceae bacterium]|nr:tail fiber domain-containing protein [Melioribacteraceae bacterium]